MENPVFLPADLRSKIELAATSEGMSVEDFVRKSLEQALRGKSDLDPLLADTAVYDLEAPDDLAVNHDEYLYGDKS